MLKKPILRKEVQDFISANLETDLHALLLKKTPFPQVTIQEIAQQVKGRKVAGRKFPFLVKEGIIFPPNLNLEQASSQATADYKATNLQGKSFLDLTCGFGIDALFLSSHFEEVTLVEHNTQLLDTVKHNWSVLGRKATFINETLETFLEWNTHRFDTVYLDPARRDGKNNKKFLLGDLTPNLLEIQDRLLTISDKIIIKLSPLIDISYLWSVLRNLSKIEIIAVKNEVKELVVYLEAENRKTKVVCVNLESAEPDFVFNPEEEASAVSVFSAPARYLYIPNSAVFKSGAFNLIAERFSLKKLHPNTHFYTSENLLQEFPGRILQVEVVAAKSIKKGEKYNLVSKNHPLSPDEIRKKYKVLDGGTSYLIFTQSVAGKIILKSK
ncbi:MAG: class I SAM-dependent methyltransferase [Weeksellaceae bacterium]|nr:class I SAM-dependent methyltransferase [Weeksellaceae bacterium]